MIRCWKRIEQAEMYRGVGFVLTKKEKKRPLRRRLRLFQIQPFSEQTRAFINPMFFDSFRALSVEPRYRGQHNNRE